MDGVNRIRELFEEVCFPNFGRTFGHGLRRKPNGEYVSDVLEDHWQTFQEGFEEAVKECSKLIETRDARTEPAPHIYLKKVFNVV